MTRIFKGYFQIINIILPGKESVCKWFIPSAALKAVMLFWNKSLRGKSDTTERSRQMSDLQKRGSCT
jgi:hypothetical protein